MKKLIIVALLGMVFGCNPKHESKDMMLDRLFYEQINKAANYMIKSANYTISGQQDSAQMYSDSADMAMYAEKMILREIKTR